MGGKLCAEQQDSHQEMARLFFNFLRISPSYTAATQYVRPKRLPKKMSLENRQVLDSYAKYGCVLSCSFEDWISNNQSFPLCTKPPIIEVIRGKDRLFVCDDDILLKLCGNQEPPSISQVVNALSQIWPNTQIKQIHSQVLKGAKLKNMWKDLLLIYIMALNPDLELWRVGSMAMLVDRFIGRLDPLAARQKSGDDHMRRHMTLMVMRHKDSALQISEQAALGGFPGPQLGKSFQTRFDFEDENFASRLFSLGSQELDCARERVIQLTSFSN
jgi:hypothetical protein